jgi:hypothetical protein
MAYPFRIEKPAAIGADTDAGGEFGQYMSRLIKLIPAEVLGIYLAVRGFWVSPPGQTAADHDSVGEIVLGWLPIVGVVLVMLSRTVGTRNATGSWASVQPIGVLIAAVSFVIWVFASGHSILGWQPPDPRIAPSAVILWIYIVPYFYKGE